MADTLRYRLTVTLVEDLHSGTGTGAGDIDALQIRDRRGRPVIRDSHFKGLLLAAGEELVALGKTRKEDLQQLLGRGGGQRGELRLTSLRLHDDSAGDTLVWTSAARVPGDRHPQDDTMRVVEHVAAGNKFIAELRLPAGSGQEPLLKQLIGRVDRLGSGRNRGGGLIRSCLDAPDRRTADVQGVGRVVRLRLRNLEPLCLPQTGSPGNLIASHAFIRGQALRGALMAWALAHGDQGAVAALKKASVGDALPLPEQLGTTGLCAVEVMPIPLSVLTPKPVGGNPDMPWWTEPAGRGAAFDDLAPSQAREVVTEKPKRPGAREFVAREAGSNGAWLRYSPTMSVHMRNQTADTTGNDRSGNPLPEPELFSVEEIAEDTLFLAELRFLSGSDAADFVKHFAPILKTGEWLGIGRGGRPVEVQATHLLDAAPSSTSQFRDTWTLTLTADMVLRGNHLGFLSGLDRDILCRLTGVSPKVNWEMRGFAETTVLHGFNAANGLPRAPVLAIRRGSCWQVTGEGCRVLASALSVKPALGERTDEGLGRFAIDIQPLADLARPTAGSTTVTNNRREDLLHTAHDLAKRPGADSPSLSKLQWLRGRALACRESRQLDALFSILDAAKDKHGGRAWNPFPRDELRSAVAGLADMEEKRQLISLMVQWIAKNKAMEERQ